MKNLKRVFCILTIVCVLCSASLTVFADHTRVVDLNDKQFYEHLSKVIITGTLKNEAKRDTSIFNTFTISYLDDEIKSFIENHYEQEYEDDIEDVREKFYSYIDDVQEKEQISRKISGNEIIENRNGKTTFWTYDESSDSYVNKDENGKTLKSISRYHLPDEDKAVSQNSAENSNGSGTVSDDDDTVSEGSASYSDNAVSADDGDSSVDSGDYQLATAENDSAAVSAEDEEEPEDDNSVTGTVLAIIGGLIVVGLGVLGYMMFRKKKEDGNGK